MSRDRLAARQAELLHALLANGPAPAGFNADRLRVEADVLRRKHARLIAHLRPDLAGALGAEFVDLFAAFAAGCPKTDKIRSREYAEEFATWLIHHCHITKPKRRLLPTLFRRA